MNYCVQMSKVLDVYNIDNIYKKKDKTEKNIQQKN